MSIKSTAGVWTILLIATGALFLLIAFALRHLAGDSLVRSVDIDAAQNHTTSEAAGASASSTADNHQDRANASLMPLKAEESSANNRVNDVATDTAGSNNDSDVAGGQQSLFIESPDTDISLAQNTDKGAAPVRLKLINSNADATESASQADATAANGGEPKQQESMRDNLESNTAGDSDAASLTPTPNLAATDNLDDQSRPAVTMPVGTTANAAGSSSSSRENVQNTDSEKVRQMPVTELDVTISAGLVQLRGVVADVANNRRWSSTFEGVANVRVLDSVAYVASASSVETLLPDRFFDALRAAVNTGNSDLQLSMRGNDFSFTGVTASERDSAELRSSLKDVDQPGFLDGVSVAYSPMKSPQLSFSLVNGKVVLNGLIDDSQIAEITRLFGTLDDFSSEASSERRVERFTYMKELRAVVGSALDTLRNSYIEAKPRRMLVRGQIVSGEVTSVRRQLLGLLPSGVALTAQLRPAPSDDAIARSQSGSRSADNTEITSGIPIAEDEDPAQTEKRVLMMGLQQDMLQIRFAPGSSQASAATISMLDRLFELLFLYSDIRASLRVHSDENSKSVENLLISRSQANNMAKYLYDRGLEKHRVAVVGVGDTRFEQIPELRLGGRAQGTLVELRFSGN